jgi:Domain of unknown function (DUF3597)
VRTRRIASLKGFAMGIFSNILKKLGLGGSDADASAASTVNTGTAQPAPSTTPTPMSQIDVVAKLDAMAKANPQKLNWKESIVDLMKLLGLDSSLAARKELATELGCPPEKMNDSAQMNVWLHKTVLTKLAQNGGNIPKELLTA